MRLIAIHLGLPLLTASCDLPGGHSGTSRSAPVHPHVRIFLIPSLFGLAPRRDYRVSPFPVKGRLVSVALIFLRKRPQWGYPRLSADGYYPLRCYLEPGLSSPYENSHRAAIRSAPSVFYTRTLYYTSVLRSKALLTNLSASLFSSRGISLIFTALKDLIRLSAITKNFLILRSFTLY